MRARRPVSRPQSARQSSRSKTPISRTKTSRTKTPISRTKTSRTKTPIKPAIIKPAASRVKSKVRGGTSALPFGMSEYIRRVYSKYSTVDTSVLAELRVNFLKTVASMGDGPESKFPLQIFHISPSGITYESEKNTDLNEMNFTLFKDAYAWAIKNKLPIPTTTMYLWVCDAHPYYITDIDKKFPIMSYVSPSNMDYILFPDGNFACMQVTQKYRGECNNFDQVKQLILSHLPSKKINQIYFKGTPTTDRQSRLREDLEKIAASPSEMMKSFKKSPRKMSPVITRMTVKLDAWTSYEPLYEWSKYKWLLNLPGRYPWSNRFRWLFLMKSGVINVDVQTVGRGYIDYPYVSFINLVVKPGVDFINVDTVYNNKIRPGANPSKADLDIQYAENTRVYREILDRTAAMTDLEYTNMVSSGFNKVNTMTSALISQYIYELMVQNANLKSLIL
jgi:hypothetical protein